MKQWVRNRVVEILRFTSRQQWHYIQTTDMIADIGTRKGTTIKDVDQSSVWTNGYQWMQNDSTTFKMSVGDFDPGIYLVTLTSNEGLSVSQKVVVR